MQVFTLFSSVFFRYDDDGAVFYDTRNYAAESMRSTPEVRKSCSLLSNIDNLNTIPVDDDNECFCKRLCDLGFGKIHDEKETVVSFPPSLALRSDWEYVKTVEGQATAEVLQYLSEITIFVGGRRDLKEYLCYQTEYPHPGGAHIDYSQLSCFFDVISKLPEVRIKLIFPYIKDFPDIIKIIDRIKGQKNITRVFVRDQEYYGNCDAVAILQPIENQVVVLNDSRHLFLNDISGSVENRFLIFDNEGLSASEECVKRFGLTNYSFIPIYDGTNEQFIKDVTLPSEEELLEGTYTRQHLFAHQVINTFYFGHLFITPDGEVFSDLMEKPIGTIRDSLHTLIIAELDNNFSWRQTRCYQTSCQRCRYSGLCPSISPLEKIMGMRCVVKNKDCFSARKQ